MYETSQLISEDLVEVLDDLILNLYVCTVHSHLQKALFLKWFVDGIDVRRSMREPKLFPMAPRK